ncbi:SRPBCC family protein [Planobispora longispora]|uniref:Polyketide cyclase n=1 Tax=Planobispora longispora TaxID=28887 RepID=A0A8J3RS89_9ACTN|nr:SRPBCC family protein [Planobispora longispora]BFE84128.1 SRPBCC family protein [Planobispora longispora]GIH78942.1 polyketide cyclase [Planobispora longispora]
MSVPSASASIEISAPPEAVYDLIADITDMSAWNAECERIRWVGPVREPRPGARFRGINRNGWRRWSTICTITAAEPGRTFAYHVRAEGVLDVAIWRFDITETENGCRVEQKTWDRRGRFMRVVGGLATGVADRAGHNAVNMRRTLESLKAVAERP